MYVCLGVYMRACVCEYACVHVCVSMHVHLDVCVCMHTCACLFLSLGQMIFLIKLVVLLCFYRLLHLNSVFYL